MKKNDVDIYLIENIFTIKYKNRLQSKVYVYKKTYGG